MRVRTRSLVIMLGQGITQASAIAVGIVLVRIISQETFGSYRQVLLVYTTLAALVSLQLDQSLYYFVPKLAPERRRALLAQTLGTALALVSAASAVMATLVVLTTEKRSREALELWQEGIRKCSLVILPCFGFSSQSVATSWFCSTARATPPPPTTALQHFRSP